MPPSHRHLGRAGSPLPRGERSARASAPRHWHAPTPALARWRRRRSALLPAATPPSPAAPQSPTGRESSGLLALLERWDLRARLARAARFTPARLAVVVFAGIIAVVTALLSLPVATADNHRADTIDSLFTATSAVCVTGLTTVDTATYWSPFGQAVIIMGAAVGGLGIMTLASLLSFAVSRHVGLTSAKDRKSVV